MPLLIRNITGNILDDLTTNIPNRAVISGAFGYGDWFIVGNLESFSQDFRKVIWTEVLSTDTTYGLTIYQNRQFIEFEINTEC
tara:strand:+ start:73722 stop:73970 length:249 start_codon:yes stop_codon:yes gene_type:complete